MAKDRQSEAVEMVSERVSDMTKQELEAFILQVVEKRAKQFPYGPYVPKSDRPVSEILESMRQNIWTPPPGAKSSLELIREDRDR